MQRRAFLKLLGGAFAGSALAAAGCATREDDTGRKPIKGAQPTDKMTYRIDPKTGQKVSLLGYGCMRWPTVSDSSAPDGDRIDQEAVNRLVDYAIAHGVNLFDTSPRYCKGRSEEALGRALSRYPRESYLLSTKMSNQGDSSREGSLKIWENSLKNLRTDYFDYYLVHAVGDMETFKTRYLDNGILDFMREQREKGLIKNLGWSFHGKKEFFDYMMNELDIKWDFVLIQLNYSDWDYLPKDARSTCNAKYQYETLVEKGIPAMVMEPLLGGRLARPNFKAQKVMKAADPEASFASWAFRFAGSLPNVLTVLSGMTYMEDLQDNLQSYSPLKDLTADEQQMLVNVAKIMEQYKNIPCTTCQYCMPCPYGIDIPTIFNQYNRSLNEDNFPAGQGEKEYLRARKAYLTGMLRRVERGRQADHCIGCHVCESRCPQGIKIADEMAKIDKYIDELKREGGQPC